MTTLEIILATLNALLTSGGIVVLATLRSTIKASKATAQVAGTDANEKLMKSYEQHILEPILKANEKTNRKLDRLTRAIEKIPSCQYANQCPVSAELQKSCSDCDGNTDNKKRDNCDT